MLRIRFQREGDSVLQYRVRIKREIGGIVYDTAAFIIYYTTKAKKIKDWYRFEFPQSYPPNSQSDTVQQYIDMYVESGEISADGSLAN